MGISHKRRATDPDGNVIGGADGGDNDAVMGWTVGALAYEHPEGPRYIGTLEIAVRPAPDKPQEPLATLRDTTAYPTREDAIQAMDMITQIMLAALGSRDAGTNGWLPAADRTSPKSRPG